MCRVLFLGMPPTAIRRACAAAEIVHATTVDAAVSMAADSPLDLVVVMQDWPDQWSEGDIGRLMRAFPLARLVCSYGPWCDSDGRNRDLWPSGSRVPRELTAARITRELQYLATQAGSILPLTAGRDEVFEYDCGETRVGPSVRIAIQSPDRAYREMLGRAVAGWECSVVALDSNPAVVLWDADPWDADRRDCLKSFASAHPQVRIVSLMGFIRDDVVAEVQRAGAQAVSPKLAPLSQLADRVRELLAVEMGQRSD
jgi:hypothetical protein